MKEAGRGTSLLFLPTPSPFFYSSHFSRGLLTLIPCSLFRNGTEALATQTTGPGLGGVSGYEGFAVYGSLLIMSLRGVWLVRHVLIIISYTVCAAIKGMIFLLLLVSCAAPPFYPHTNSPN